MNNQELKEKYLECKKKLDEIRSNATLNNWKILSKAYKLGKKIWGPPFTRIKLSKDMGIPMTTTLRCLALDKANKQTWNLIKDKKITAFKAAQICQTKSNRFQDEIMNLVIKDNLSTYQIKTLKIKDFEDISKEKHRMACEEGYSRKSSAYFNFKSCLRRFKVFLLMDQKHLPENKIEELKKDLKEIKNLIGRYLK